MPSTSAAQHRLMAAVAHDPKFARKVGIPQKVGLDFFNADKRKGLATGGVSVAPNVNVFPLPAGDISTIAASDAVSPTNQFAAIANGMPAIGGTAARSAPDINTGNILASVPVGGTSGAMNSPYGTSIGMDALTGKTPMTIPGSTIPASAPAAAPATSPPAAPAAAPLAPMSVSGNVGNSPFSATVPPSGTFTATGPNNSVIQFAAQDPTSPTITGTSGNSPVTIQNPFFKPAAADGGRIHKAGGGPLGGLGGMGMGGMGTSSLFNSLFGGKGNFFDELFGIGGGGNSTTTGGGGGDSTLSTLGTLASIASFFFNKGGRVPFSHGGGLAQCYDSGGAPSSGEMGSWTTRQDARGMDDIPHVSGLFKSAGAGRTDILNRSVPAGGYVVPADVVSGLAEGNTLAGSAVIDKMMNTGPYGTKLPRHGAGGVGIPHPPPAYREPKAGGGAAETVPVKTAGGEHFIPPEAIAAKFGDLDRGHKILDAWVLHERQKHIKTLKKLPGPKK